MINNEFPCQYELQQMARPLIRPHRTRLVFTESNVLFELIQLPYECRIDWTREEAEILKQGSLSYIRSQPDNTTYDTEGSSDGTRVAAAVVHNEEDIIIRLNNSASVLNAEMTAIRLALEDASETRNQIRIHTDSLTAVNILNNGKLNLNTPHLPRGSEPTSTSRRLSGPDTGKR